MSETVLYRKYRPKEFKDVVGQEHVVNALSSAIKHGNIGHAYLFSGSRGTGKTSVARILARGIGCGDDDIYEIDAASNTSVDDVRELRDSVHSLPLSSPYKLYIIDEVHMLSKSAFNALLKTLEEPPAHVVFVLATTEEHKLPDTVISRCESYEFKKPNIHTLSGVVKEIAKKEGVELEPASAELIALLAEGSYRDAQSALQKVTSSASGKKMPHEDVERITGAPKSALIRDFVEAVDGGETDAALKAVARAAEANIDMSIFLKLALRRMRFVLLLKFGKDLAEHIKAQIGEDEFAELARLAKEGKGGINSAALSEFIAAGEKIGKAHVAELPIELAILNLTKAES